MIPSAGGFGSARRQRADRCSPHVCPAAAWGLGYRLFDLSDAGHAVIEHTSSIQAGEEAVSTQKSPTRVYFHQFRANGQKRVELRPRQFVFPKERRQLTERDLH